MGRKLCITPLLILVLAGCQAIDYQQPKTAADVRLSSTERFSPTPSDVKSGAQTATSRPSIVQSSGRLAEGPAANEQRRAAVAESAIQTRRIDRAEVSNIARMLTKLIEQDNPAAVAARKAADEPIDYAAGNQVAHMLSALVEQEKVERQLASSSPSNFRQLDSTEIENVAGLPNEFSQQAPAQFESDESGLVVTADYEHPTATAASVATLQHERRTDSQRSFSNWESQNAQPVQDDVREEIALLTAKMASMVACVEKLAATATPVQPLAANIENNPPRQALGITEIDMSAKGEVSVEARHSEPLFPHFQTHFQAQSSFARRIPFARQSNDVHRRARPLD